MKTIWRSISNHSSIGRTDRNVSTH